MHKQLFFIAVSLLLAACASTSQSNTDQPVKTGAEVLLDRHLEELSGKRIGLVMNPTARVNDVHMLDTLRARGLNITALFAPEHGFRGEAGAGEIIEDGVDQETGLPVHSLYGTTRKPTQEMLADTDLLIFDIQDVGVRYYTYITTLGLVLEAAAEAEIPVWILDRPNPLGGNYISGWVLEEEFKSFVGPYPIPAVHGLTMGEIGLMMVREGWITFENEPAVHVIEMEGWQRDMIWPDTGLAWIPPSPNLGTFDQAFVYPGTVFFEGTNLSEGRGTEKPFLLLGSPETDLSDRDIVQLDDLSDQINIKRTEFTPVSIPGKAPTPKHQDKKVKGIEIEVTGYDFDPFRIGLKILQTLVNATPDAEIKPFMYNLTGTKKIDGLLSGDANPMTVDFNNSDFIELRKTYLLYD